jgi:hypothetical protein
MKTILWAISNILVEEEFVERVIKLPIFEYVMEALSSSNNYVQKEAVMCFYTIVKHKLPQITMALLGTQMLMNILAILQSKEDIELLKYCLCIIYEILTLSNFIEENIQVSTIKEYFYKLDGANVLERLCIVNKNTEIYNLVQNILNTFCVREQL